MTRLNELTKDQTEALQKTLQRLIVKFFDEVKIPADDLVMLVIDRTTQSVLTVTNHEPLDAVTIMRAHADTLEQAYTNQCRSPQPARAIDPKTLN